MFVDVGCLAAAFGLLPYLAARPDASQLSQPNSPIVLDKDTSLENEGKWQTAKGKSLPSLLSPFVLRLSPSESPLVSSLVELQEPEEVACKINTNPQPLISKKAAPLLPIDIKIEQGKIEFDNSLSFAQSRLKITEQNTNSALENSTIDSHQWQRLLSSRKESNLTGDFSRLQGGAHFNQFLQKVGKVSFESPGLPLQMSFRAKAAEEEKYGNLVHKLKFKPSSQFRLNFKGNRDRNRLFAEYEPFTGLELQGSWDNQGTAAEMELEFLLWQELKMATTAKLQNPDSGDDKQILDTKLSWQEGDFSASVESKVNSVGRSRWKSHLGLGEVEIQGWLSSDRRRNASKYTLKLSYTPTEDDKEQIDIRHQSFSKPSEEGNLTVISWTHRREPSSELSAWKWEIGYGSGSLGSGAIASITTPEFLGGLQLRGTYSGVALTSDAPNFSFKILFE